VAPRERTRFRGGGDVSVLARAPRAVVRAVVGFIVGDTPGLFVAVLCVVGAAFALAHVRVAAAIVLPVIAAVGVVVSAARGARRLSGATTGRGRRTRGSPGAPPGGA
jgi:hypothetical protein